MTRPPASDTISFVKAYLAVFGATILTAVACGARSELDVPVPPARDAGVDAPPDVVDAPPDVVDAPPDVPVADDCLDAGITYIYVITEENFLYAYDPPANVFHFRGVIDCPAPPGDTPFSMAVDRQGTAYVVFSPGGDLFRVSTANASCKPTGFLPHQNGFTPTFGMGFSANPSDPGETLYVASDSTGTMPERLATIDTTTFDLSVVGPFDKVIGNAELTGTGDSKLYGFGVQSPTIHLAQIDKDTANILDDVFLSLPGGNTVTAWAFAFWGGDFYFFTSAQNGTSTVSRYTPGGPTSPTPIGALDKTIVGAGVSTCAPQ